MSTNWLNQPGAGALGPRAPFEIQHRWRFSEREGRETTAGGLVICGGDRVRGERRVRLCTALFRDAQVSEGRGSDQPSSGFSRQTDEGAPSFGACHTSLTEEATTSAPAGLQVEPLHEWSRGYSSNTSPQTESRERRERQRERKRRRRDWLWQEARQQKHYVWTQEEVGHGGFVLSLSSHVDAAGLMCSHSDSAFPSCLPTLPSCGGSPVVHVAAVRHVSFLQLLIKHLCYRGCSSLVFVWSSDNRDRRRCWIIIRTFIVAFKESAPLNTLVCLRTFRILHNFCFCFTGKRVIFGLSKPIHKTASSGGEKKV